MHEGRQNLKNTAKSRKNTALQENNKKRKELLNDVTIKIENLASHLRYDLSRKTDHIDSKTKSILSVLESILEDLKQSP